MASLGERKHRSLTLKKLPVIQRGLLVYLLLATSESPQYVIVLSTPVGVLFHFCLFYYLFLSGAKDHTQGLGYVRQRLAQDILILNFSHFDGNVNCL